MMMRKWVMYTEPHLIAGRLAFIFHSLKKFKSAKFIGYDFKEDASEILVHRPSLIQIESTQFKWKSTDLYHTPLKTVLCLHSGTPFIYYYQY